MDEVAATSLKRGETQGEKNTLVDYPALFGYRFQFFFKLKNMG